MHRMQLVILLKFGMLIVDVSEVKLPCKAKKNYLLGNRPTNMISHGWDLGERSTVSWYLR
jgi:hypothetical protein